MSDQSIEKYKRTLPKLSELYNEDDVALLKRENDLNILLNEQPRQDWIHNHPIAKKEIIVNGEKKFVPIQYIPIGRIEWLLTRIFIKWHVEIKDVKLIGNSVVVTVRVHYLSPVDGEWSFQDGVGANPIQVNRDKPATDWNEIKSNAVQIATPAAESYAIKDAVEKLGKLFGKDLNRMDEIAYDMLAGTFAGETKSEVMIAVSKIIAGFDKYTGADAEALKKTYAAKLKDNKMTIEDCRILASKIGVVL